MDTRENITPEFVVIGAGGFLGSALVRTLVEMGHAVAGTYRKHQVDAPGIALVGDLEDEIYCRRIAETPGTLIYAAAFKKNISVHTAEPFTTFVENVSPLLKLLKALEKSPPRPLIYASSILIGSHEVDAKLHDGYVDGKTAGEMAVVCFRNQYAWPVAILRIASIYGPGNDVNPKTANVVPALITRVAQSEGRVDCWGSGQRRVQFSYIDDAVRALLHVAMNPSDIPYCSVGNEESISIDGLVMDIASQLGKDVEIVHDLSKPDKETALFHFTNPVQPEVSVHDGVARTIAWMKQNGYVE